LVIFQLWSASFRMPLGLGKVVIFEYIEVALGLFVVNDIDVAGSVSKRKVWRRGPKLPWGSIARGMRTMLCVRRLPIIVSPTVMVPVVGSFFCRVQSSFFHIFVDVYWHWPLILLLHWER
jgi:hypothetical protein